MMVLAPDLLVFWVADLLGLGGVVWRKLRKLLVVLWHDPIFFCTFVARKSCLWHVVAGFLS